MSDDEMSNNNYYYYMYIDVPDEYDEIISLRLNNKS
jgi:hypothetical protein